jgi:NAD(P)-dependent dehydrogenase (short-subunit alcohol dehydrogenase family)
MPGTTGALLVDHTALVTGAASGIGRATALRLAAEGARVALADRDLPGAEAAAAEIRARDGAASPAWPLALDVTSEAGWKAAMVALEARWGDLDIAVLAAGISHAAPLTETTLEDWRRVMSVNADGCFLGVRAAARAMRTRKTGRAGRIVLVSSVSGRKATPGAAAYAASKAAVSMLARSAALELISDDIRVNAVLPGAVRTPMWRAMPAFRDLVEAHTTMEDVWRAMESQSPGPGQKRFAAPEEIADGILYLVSDASRFATGMELVLDGGYST